ncbi:single-stranded DNA-binding protein [Symbioplanes lichenis]|uniref:single-stranded DNA-binding protein n=1 Tax=Symbioplanes lichenis TaxID=1629072 RepID=UPI002739307C|nr:single-stranded DNA-binding protein [Actinoplanes lichenis]
MFDTTIVVIGNVLTAPEWRRTTNSQTLVANFRVASTSRRYDRENGNWTDGSQFRIRVTCWRRLAEGVAASVKVGDPIMVSGRLATRDWTDADGQRRTTYEMDAHAVGHDLSRGRAKFYRNKHLGLVTADVPETDDKVRGESATVVPDDEAPASYGQGVPESEVPTFAEPFPQLEPAEEALPVLAGGGLEPFDTRLTRDAVAGGHASEEAEKSDDAEKEEEAEEAEESEKPDEQTPAEPVGESLPDDVVRVVSPRRTRTRSPRRQPVAA